VVARPAAVVVAAPHKPPAQPPKFDPWEHAYRALEKRHETSKLENARLVALNQALKQKHDPDVAALRSELAAAKNALEPWKQRALTAETAARSPEALAAAAEKSVKAASLVRARAHAELVEAQNASLKSLLRIAVIGLRGAGAAQTLETLEAADPGITNDCFCYPERFTHEERQAAKEAAKAAREGGAS
jgi:hypothetical protein